MATTYVVAGSRAGIGSVVIVDGGSGDTFMVAGLGADNDPVISVSASPAITGVSGTGQIGTITMEGDSSVTLSGIAAAASVGSFGVEVDSSNTLTGVTGTGHVGTITVRVVNPGGFFHGFP
jgi:hypothetical protein